MEPVGPMVQCSIVKTQVLPFCAGSVGDTIYRLSRDSWLTLRELMSMVTAASQFKNNDQREEGSKNQTVDAT